MVTHYFLNSDLKQRDIVKRGVPCFILEHKEFYEFQFEWVQQKDNFHLKLLYRSDSGTETLFDRKLDIKQLFNGRSEFSECFDPKPVNVAAGCKNCNLLCLRLFNMKTGSGSDPFVFFYAKVEQIVCAEEYWSKGIDACYNNYIKLEYCNASYLPIVMRNKIQLAIEAYNSEH
uniref:Uncharacterized protein n=1 Tax=Romanomermis culicivorax TaxID=13658 RepID=A0A915K285_ROMCU